MENKNIYNNYNKNLEYSNKIDNSNINEEKINLQTNIINNNYDQNQNQNYQPNYNSQPNYNLQNNMYGYNNQAGIPNNLSFNEQDNNNSYSSNFSEELNMKENENYQKYDNQDYSNQNFNNQDYNSQDYNSQDYNNQDYNSQNYNNQDYNNQNYSNQNYNNQDYSNQSYNNQDYSNQNYDNYNQQKDFNEGYDLRKNINFNQNYSFSLAPMGLRLKSYLLDKIFIFIPIFISYYLFLHLSVFEIIREYDKLDYYTIFLNVGGKIISFLILVAAIYIAYYIFLPYFNNGQTFGKKINGIHIIMNDEDNPNPSLGTYFKREILFKFLSSILFIGYIISFFSKKRIAIHDKQSNTRVVFVDDINITNNKNSKTKKEKNKKQKIKKEKSKKNK